ncbi:hypothetical protein, partial [Pseudarthrobacter phenanthrenivorans]|uniref:hypothetical protein n=1 Tax=Pseudarthrobacter phenanthrenivorans TaxID=361575 RepID=UPI001C7D7A40
DEVEACAKRVRYYLRWPVRKNHSTMKTGRTPHTVYRTVPLNPPWTLYQLLLVLSTLSWWSMPVGRWRGWVGISHLWGRDRKHMN